LRPNLEVILSEMERSAMESNGSRPSGVRLPLLLMAHLFYQKESHCNLITGHYHGLPRRRCALLGMTS